MRLLHWLMLCVCAVAAAAQTHNVTRRESGSGSGKRVVCYYTNWSVYRPGTAKFSPQNINPYLCTHLIYAFGGLTRENGLRPYDKYQDIEQGGYAKFTGLKTYNKQLKTMLAIGGWNEGSTRFSPLVADEERRAELVHNVVRFLRQNHFDGLDLDWEYPAFRDGGKARDRQNYALLVQQLRAEFDRESAKTGRSRLLLTMAVPAGIEYIDKGYDIPKLNRYLDFMNILSYDYHSAFEPAVNHHSPLYPLEEDSEYNFDAQLSIDYTINHYMKLGADRDKLVLGIPTYGRSYTLFNPLATEIGAPTDGPGEQGDATREKGYLAYYEICDSLKSDDWKVEHPNPSAMGPYAFKGNQWVGYDDIDIVKLKARYVSENGLGGIMFWAIDNDDFRGKCHGRPYPLIEAGKEALLAGSGTSNDVVSIAPSRGNSKTRQKRPNVGSSSISTGSGSGRQGPQGQRPHKRRPSSRRHHDKPVRSTTPSITTTTSTTPVYYYPQTTPEPPTTPDPGSDFMCKDEGFFPHPRDCKKYFWCLDSGPSNLGIVAHQFTCPSGLFFNKAADSCDYARNVVCKKKSGGSVSSTTRAPSTTAATTRTTRISSTTTTTTTTTPEPIIEDEEYDDEEYEDEEDAGEDPQAIKELINLIKKLGGVEQLEKQLHLQDSEQDNKPNSGFSRSLYDRVLSRSNNRGNGAFGGEPSTTPKYTSVYRNRPVRPQNEGLDGFDEVKALRREKPQYVTIRRERPSTPVPEEVDEEEEEEEEDIPLATNDERDRGNDARSQGNPVEYVTIRRTRPSTSVDTDTTTPRYITIQRSRKPTPEPDVDDTERDSDVQDITTEIRPVYTGTTERQPESKIQIVTPSRTSVAQKQNLFRKVNRDEEVETTTLEPEQKVSGGFRGKSSESSLGTYPQYVDVTSIGRRRQSTTTSQIEADTEPLTTSFPSPDDVRPYLEVNSVNRRRNIFHTNDLTDTSSTISPQSSPEDTFTEGYPRYVDVTSIGRKRGTTLPSTAIPDEETFKPIEPERPKHVDFISRRRGTTLPTKSDIPTTTEHHQTHKHNAIYRRRGTTVPTTYNIQYLETQPQGTDTEESVQTLPPPTTTPISFVESTPQDPSIPETLPPPSSTRFTPTVTRVITSVTESGTTERQRIAINRVPYIAIAALRGETVYPGPVGQNRYSTVPLDQRILHPTTIPTVPIPYETTSSSVEHNTIPVTIPTEQKLEKVMEVNRITLVTLKEELPLAYTRALPGNETTERMLIDVQSEKTMDKVSEVTRLKFVTVVGGSQTPLPGSESTTDGSGGMFSTLPTLVGDSPETTYHENVIDIMGEIQSVKPQYHRTTINFENFSSDPVTTTEPLFAVIRTKQTEPTTSADNIVSTVSSFNNKRRQNTSRNSGVDDFKRRRTRPSFTRSTTESVVSSTPSVLSQRRRGQRKRPRPYRPTSTTAADVEDVVVPQSVNDSTVAKVSSDSERNNSTRRTFIPKRGQRNRPRPYRPTSTTSSDKILNFEENDGTENIVLPTTETIPEGVTGFVPKKGTRRRGTTQKAVLEPTAEITSQKNVDLLTTDKLKAFDETLTTVSTDPITNTDTPSENYKINSENLDGIEKEKSKLILRDYSENIPTTSLSSLTSTTDGNTEVSTFKYNEITEPSDFKNNSLNFENVQNGSSVSNSTESDTNETSPKVNDVLRGTTFRPSSLNTYTEPVAFASTKFNNARSSTESATTQSEKVRVKKRRRRPVTRSSGAPTSQTEKTTESTSEGTASLTNNLRITQNEIGTDIVTFNTSTTENDEKESSVTSFATAALLGRDHYEISTTVPTGEFVTTVDRSGKHMVKISVLNDPIDKAAVHKNQRNKFGSDKNKRIANNTNNNNNNNRTIETSSNASESSDVITTEESDLSTDGSGYTTGNNGKNSVYTLSASVKSSSEEVHDHFMTATVEFPTEGPGDGSSNKKSKATVKASTRQQPKDYFIASIDFTTDSGVNQTLGSTAATRKPVSGRNGGANKFRDSKPRTTSSEAKRTRLVRRKRPSSTTVEPQIQSEVVTTTVRSLRRPTGALFNPNRVRQRSTTTTTTTTETPTSSSVSPLQRRKPGARVVRRRKYGSSTNRTRDSDATSSDVDPTDASNISSSDKDGAGGRVRKYSFPRRRVTTTPSPATTTAPPPITTILPQNDPPEVAPGDMQLLESKKHQASDPETEDESITTKLPDLANAAVVAIHNLATAPPTTQPTPDLVKTTRTAPALQKSSPVISSTPAIAPLFPRRGSTVFVSEQQPSSSTPSLASPRRLSGSSSLRPRPFSKTTPAPVPTTSPRARTARPKLPPIVDYEYYDDDDVGILDVAPVSGKVKIHSDGYIECLDRGNFPHPFSCKKFISCAKMENGDLLGWEYTCPRQLSFDPIGGICNWSAGLGCKE